MNKLKRNSFGLAQIPLMIGLLLMAVVVPAATKLVQQNQENRGQAMEVECTTDLQCGNGYKCQANSCKWVGFPTVRPTSKPTSKPTDKPSTGGSTDKPAYCSNWNAQNCEYGCTASSSGGKCNPTPTGVIPDGSNCAVGTVRCFNNTLYKCTRGSGTSSLYESVQSCPYGCEGTGNCAAKPTPTIPISNTSCSKNTEQKCLDGINLICECKTGTCKWVAGGSWCTPPNPAVCGCVDGVYVGQLCNRAGTNCNITYPSITPTRPPIIPTTTSVTGSCLSGHRVCYNNIIYVCKCAGISCSYENNYQFCATPTYIPTATTPSPIGTVQPINTPVSTSAPVADSCGRGWSCTSKSGGTACINAGGEIDSCKKSNGATGNCCIPNGGGNPVATNTPGSGGGNPPATNPTTVSGGGGTTTTGCTECSKTFKCYSNGTEFKWFVDGFAMTGFNKVTTGTNVTTCNGVAKPTFLGKSKGDANCDGVININDYSLWHTEFYSGDAGSVVKKTWNADFTGPNGKCDGKVDIRDFSLWHSNFNN